MATAEEYSGLPIEARLQHLDQTPGELERAICGKTANELSARPDARNWAAKEIVCHLRDVEELFQIRFHTVVALDEPRLLVFGASSPPRGKPVDLNLVAEGAIPLCDAVEAAWRRAGIEPR